MGANAPAIVLLVCLPLVLTTSRASAQNANVVGERRAADGGSRFERQEFFGSAATSPAQRADLTHERPQPYDFGYNIQDEYGNNQLRQESGDANGAVTGTYGYTDALGIYRSVKYVADIDGYRAEVKSNEPGMKQESPASATFVIDSPPQGVYREVVVGSVGTGVARPSGTRRRVVGSGRFPASASLSLASEESNSNLDTVTSSSAP